MPYTSFDNIKPIEHKDCCSNCIHKIYISKNLCRCSILNKFVFKDQILAERCTYIDEVINKNRKVIFGIFTYGENIEVQWTGMLSYGNVINKNDNDVVKELSKAIKEDIYKMYPKLKNTILFYCLVAECINDRGFQPIGKLIANNVLYDIVKDANDKFM